jgi:phosphate transport system permease protein
LEAILPSRLHNLKFKPLKRQNLTQQLVFGSFRLLSILVVAILFSVLGYILVKGFNTILDWQFWSDVPRNSLVEGGIFPAIMGTVFLTLLSIFFTCLIGIPAGIYMAEYAPRGRLKSVIDIMTNNLAGIPSIVFGLFGMSLFVVGLGFGDSLLAGGLTLAIMVLPVVIRTTEQALLGVPQELRMASTAMGASQYQTIKRVIMPMALPNIITGIVLSIGRVAGETAPILFTVAALYLPRLPHSFFDQVMALPYHLYALSVSSPNPDQSLPMAFGTATVLVLIVLAMNLLANFIRRRFTIRYSNR